MTSEELTILRNLITAAQLPSWDGAALAIDRGIDLINQTRRLHIERLKLRQAASKKVRKAQGRAAA